jgi:hypothetical protein
MRAFGIMARQSSANPGQPRSSKISESVGRNLPSIIGIREMLPGVFYVLLSIGFVACSSIRGDTALLTFLKVGETTRQDVYLRLGEPSAEYEEQSRIVTYRIGEDSGGYFLIRAVEVYRWTGVRYSLVLAFDGEQVLRRQSLVRIDAR